MGTWRKKYVYTTKTWGGIRYLNLKTFHGWSNMIQKIQLELVDFMDIQPSGWHSFHKKKLTSTGNTIYLCKWYYGTIRRRSKDLQTTQSLNSSNGCPQTWLRKEMEDIGTLCTQKYKYNPTNIPSAICILSVMYRRGLETLSA